MPRIMAVTRLVAHENRFDDLLEAVDGMVAAAREEPGTEAYLVGRALEAPGTLLLFELFTDRAALRAHAEAGARIADLLRPLVARTEVTLGELAAGTGMPC
jgi:quinol monooxygenase YgiN